MVREAMDEDLSPVKLVRTKSWKEYDAHDEIPFILNEGLLPVKFQTSETDLDYEGALRFYFEDGNSELTKAVRLTNRTTTEGLIPTLVEKFSLPSDGEYALYEIHEKDELQHTVLLYPDECPLARAISNKKVPRFVLRSKDENSNSVELNETPTKKEKRKKLFSFNRHSEDRPDKEKKPKVAKGKKGKINKSAISVQVNHLDESAFSSEGEADQTVAEDTATYETIENLNSAIPQEEAESIKQVVNLDSDPEEPHSLVINGESFQNVNTVDDANDLEPDENHQSVDEEEDKETVAPLASPVSVELKRKLSFSNSSVFFEQDNDPPVLEKRKSSKKKDKTDKKKKSKSTSRTKSFSKMVRGNKKKADEKDPTAQTELSTYKLAPGILKIFGDHVLKTSNYKAVRASTISTSQEVVRMALERYGLEDHDAKDYVLCDVVGHFSTSEASTPGKKRGSKKEKPDENDEEEPKWITEYVRAISDNEKPLVLQSLWKPTNGRARRFELRKRVEIESSCFFINTADGMGRSSSQTSLFDDSEHSSIGNEYSEKAEYAPVQMSPHTNSRKITQRQENEDSNKAPQYTPYLLLMSGFDSRKDQLIHKLEDPTNVVGAYVENELKQCNVVLYSADVLLPHCWIYKKVKLEQDSSETNLDEINFLVFIEPANGADITVNGIPVVTSTQIKPGNLVSFGQDYLFIFKDPTQSEVSRSNLSWWNSVCHETQVDEVQTSEVVYSKVSKTVGVQVEILKDEESDDQSDDSDDEDSTQDFEQKQSNLAARRKVQKSGIQLAYQIKDEEELLHSIIEIAEKDAGDFKLIPAYFLVMTIEHSAATFTEIQTRKLLLKICNGLQGIAWEKTKEIGKQSSVKLEDPSELLDKVLPGLKPVLFWMANALEMLHFLQNRLSKYLLPKEQVTTNKEDLLTADEELLTVLEEVIMFTFQQTVYHLTKVLYIALPAIIDSNPFRDTEGSEREGEKKIHNSVAIIPKVFQRILNAANEYQVHAQITQQLFAYLFFFSNASLFNSLMERGPGGNFYSWSKGVQMRGNLDVLEDWAQANGLSSQFNEYMAKFTSAVDLLATTKVQLLQQEWNQMRTDNQALSPAQLQQLLSEYQLGGKQRPRGWYPPPEEVEPALRTSEVLESFATHPPLMLPSTNFVMNLDEAPSNQHFKNHLHDLKLKFDADKTTVTSYTEHGGGDKSSPNKSKKIRTQSNIDMDDLQAARNLKNKSEEENTSSETTLTQVGSIKSIQVQSKKTSVRVRTSSSGRTPSSSDENTHLNGHTKESDDYFSPVDDIYDIPKNYDGNKDDLFETILTRRSEGGLGLGLIDGMFTSLQCNGIYIRTIVPNTPASEDTRLRVGDRILAVNRYSLVGAGYNEAMDVIKKSGNELRFLIAKSDDDVMNQVLATAT